MVRRSGRGSKARRSGSRRLGSRKKARKTKPRKNKPKRSRQHSKKKVRAGQPAKKAKSKATKIVDLPIKTIKKEPSKHIRMLNEPPSYKNKYFTKMPERVEADLLY